MCDVPLMGVNHVLHAQATFVDESPPWTLDQIAGLAFGVRTGSEISHIDCPCLGATDIPPCVLKLSVCVIDSARKQVNHQCQHTSCHRHCKSDCILMSACLKIHLEHAT